MHVDQGFYENQSNLAVSIVFGVLVLITGCKILIEYIECKNV